ncbi:MAG: CPBP family intramembrane metalloprotease [Planctomycetes bacterium]|nr:CPBP family intramembrane metalloprotease [Planctomycetota bacterium]
MTLERPPHLRAELATALLFFVGLSPLYPLLDAIWPEGAPSVAPAYAVAPHDALYLLQVLAFLALTRRFRGERWAELSMPRIVPGLDLCFGVFVFCAGYAISVLLVYMVATLPPLYDGRPGPPIVGPWPLVVIGLIGTTCVSVAEELFFRAYLLRRLTQLTGSAGQALLWSSLVFGAMHSYQGFWPPLQHAAWGFVLGSFVLLLGRVWPAALAHVLQNFCIEALAAG